MNGSTSLPLPPLAPVAEDGGGAYPTVDPQVNGAPTDGLAAPQAQPVAAVPLPAPAASAPPHLDPPTGPPPGAEAATGPQPPAGPHPIAPPAAGQPPTGQPATVAERTMHAAGFLPLVPCPGAYEPWPCRCAQCGREATPTYRQVRDEAFTCACRGTRRRRPSRRR
ncbi:hypothetical protein ACGH2B_14195 [Streptomyces sp. BBFR2]|uniref:hypothetical protein n=1 Tax=Streptomyces sp. BBFR2 TaxID=3372854 RepID=UPI0037D9AB5F